MTDDHAPAPRDILPEHLSPLLAQGAHATTAASILRATGSDASPEALAVVRRWTREDNVKSGRDPDEGPAEREERVRFAKASRPRHPSAPT